MKLTLIGLMFLSSIAFAENVAIDRDYQVFITPRELNMWEEEAAAYVLETEDITCFVHGHFDLLRSGGSIVPKGTRLILVGEYMGRKASVSFKILNVRELTSLDCSSKSGKLPPVDELFKLMEAQN